jgi:hypothetical protein
MRNALLAVAALLAAATATAADAREPANFVFAGGDDATEVAELMARPDIDGVQIIYNWRQLEPREGVYDFSKIERDLAVAAARHKTLWIQLQDRFFYATSRNLPDYILTQPQYDGGLQAQLTFVAEDARKGVAWVAKQWNPALRARFQALIAALAARFDGRIAGFNFDETAIDLGDDASRFDCDGYFAAELENARFARKAFGRTPVVQYVNFWPCQWGDTRSYFSRFFAAAAADGIGLGGPDIVPWKRVQMKNSYPFFHSYRGKLALVAMAVQEPTLSYIDPQTGKQFTRSQFVDFATDYLGVDVIFWSKESPWLRSAGRDEAP